jgi:hypothetical protein
MWLPVPAGLVMTVGLYARWRMIFYLLLGNSLLAFVAAITGMAFMGDNLLALVGSGVSLVLSIAIVIVVLQLEGDFQVRKERLTVGLDRQLNSGTEYLLRGRLYAQKGLWTLAVLHFRRAAALSTFTADGHIALARACLHLNDFDLARWALEEAQARRPDDQRIRDVAALLAQEREGASFVEA